MKYISLVLFFCSVMSISVFGQHSFELIFENYPGARVGGALTLDRETFVLEVTGLTNTEFPRSFVEKNYRLFKDGELEEVVMPWSIGDYYTFHMREWQDGYLWDTESTLPIGSEPPSWVAPFRRCILELDRDFNLIDSFCFTVDGPQYGKATIDDDDVYIFATNEGVVNRSLSYGIYSSSRKEVSRRSHNNNVLSYPTALVRSFRSANYFLHSYPGVYEVNQEFDMITDMRPIFRGNGTHGYMMNIDKDLLAISGIKKLFIQGPGAQTYIHNLITLDLVDRNYNILWSDTMGIIPDPVSDVSGFNNPAVEKTLDTLDGYIFFTGMNRIIGNWIFTDVPNSIFVAKYDIATGETIWKYDQLNTDYYTAIIGVYATADGGCLLHGFRTDPATAISYPYVLKIGADGLITTNVNEEVDHTFRFTLYGNPSNTLRFNISAGSDWQGRYQLIDMNGRIVLQESAQTGQHEASVNNLSAGMYIVLVMDEDGKVVAQRKWIKE